MSEWTRIGRVLMACALLVGALVSCGGEPSSEPVSPEEASQQARQEHGGTFAQLAARTQLPAEEQGEKAQAAEAPEKFSPLDLFSRVDGELPTELPEDFHASIREYPGMTVEAFSADEDIAGVVFTVTEPPQSALDTLSERLRDEGWTLSEVVKDEGGDILGGEKGDQFANFVLMPGEEAGTTRITGSIVQK
jgi:hypothetical protein